MRRSGSFLRKVPDTFIRALVQPSNPDNVIKVLGTNLTATSLSYAYPVTSESYEVLLEVSCTNDHLYTQSFIVHPCSDKPSSAATITIAVVCALFGLAFLCFVAEFIIRRNRRKRKSRANLFSIDTEFDVNGKDDHVGWRAYESAYEHSPYFRSPEMSQAPLLATRARDSDGSIGGDLAASSTASLDLSLSPLSTYQWSLHEGRYPPSLLQSPRSSVNVIPADKRWSLTPSVSITDSETITASSSSTLHPVISLPDDDTGPIDADESILPPHYNPEWEREAIAAGYAPCSNDWKEAESEYIRTYMALHPQDRPE